MNDAARIRVLREQLEEAREEIRQLKASAQSPAFFPPAAWRLSQTETLLLALLSTREFVSHEAGEHWLTSTLDRHWLVQPKKLIQVYVHKLRRKLAPHGFSIETRWGEGHYITAEHRAAIAAVCKRESA